MYNNETFLDSAMVEPERNDDMRADGSLEILSSKGENDSDEEICV